QPRDAPSAPARGEGAGSTPAQPPAPYRGAVGSPGAGELTRRQVAFESHAERGGHDHAPVVPGAHLLRKLCAGAHAPRGAPPPFACYAERGLDARRLGGAHGTASRRARRCGLDPRRAPGIRDSGSHRRASTATPSIPPLRDRQREAATGRVAVMTTRLPPLPGAACPITRVTRRRAGRRPATRTAPPAAARRASAPGRRRCRDLRGTLPPPPAAPASSPAPGSCTPARPPPGPRA